MISTLILRISILCGVGVVIFIFGFKKMQQWADNNRRKRSKQIQEPDCTFSLSEYFKHIEQEELKWLEEKEYRKRHPIPLEFWLGLEGWQIYPDGTTKKIRRSSTQNIDICTVEDQIREGMRMIHETEVSQFYMEPSQKIIDRIEMQQDIQNAIAMQNEHMEAVIQHGFAEQTVAINAGFMVQQKLISDAYRARINPHSPQYSLLYNPNINYFAATNNAITPTVLYDVPCEGMNNNVQQALGIDISGKRQVHRRMEIRKHSSSNRLLWTVC